MADDVTPGAPGPSRSSCSSPTGASARGAAPTVSASASSTCCSPPSSARRRRLVHRARDRDRQAGGAGLVGVAAEGKQGREGAPDRRPDPEVVSSGKRLAAHGQHRQPALGADATGGRAGAHGLRPARHVEGAGRRGRHRGLPRRRGRLVRALRDAVQGAVRARVDVVGRAETLLHRQALELSLYTLKYVDSVDSVVVFMPPSKDQPNSTVFLRRSDVAEELDRPLNSLLPTTRPKVGGLDSLEEGQIVRLTQTRTYAAEVQASPDGSPILILSPPGASPDLARVNVPHDATQGSRHGRGQRHRPRDRGAAGARTAHAVLAVDLRPDPDGPGEPFEADLATPAGNRAAVDAALERLGGIDAVVASAGFQHVAPIEEFPEERWEALLAVLLTSPFLLARYAWEALRESGDGRFLAVASVHGLVASPYKAGYVAAKHGCSGS